MMVVWLLMMIDREGESAQIQGKRSGDARVRYTSALSKQRRAQLLFQNRTPLHYTPRQKNAPGEDGDDVVRKPAAQVVAADRGGRDDEQAVVVEGDEKVEDDVDEENDLFFGGRRCVGGGVGVGGGVVGFWVKSARVCGAPLCPLLSLD